MEENVSGGAFRSPDVGSGDRVNLVDIRICCTISSRRMALIASLVAAAPLVAPVGCQLAPIEPILGVMENVPQDDIPVPPGFQLGKSWRYEGFPSGVGRFRSSRPELLPFAMRRRAQKGVVRASANPPLNS